MVDSDAVRAWIEWNRRSYAAHGFGLWAVELKPSARLIGDCGLTYQDVGGETVLEVGYHVLATERRKGYALEAARACLDLGFRQTASDMICSIVSPANTGSRAVATRLHADCRELVREAKAALLFFTERWHWSDRPDSGSC